MRPLSALGGRGNPGLFDEFASRLVDPSCVVPSAARNETRSVVGSSVSAMVTVVYARGRSSRSEEER